MAADTGSNGGVYAPTTEPRQPDPSNSICQIEKRLGLPRFSVKVVEVLFSFVAFILEEVVMECTSCGGLYFFEFVSCSAFLLSLILLMMLSTKCFDKVQLGKWQLVDFICIVVIGGFFLIASIVFAATHNETTLEKASIAFGFLASFAFAVDAIFILRRDNPFQQTKKDTPPVKAAPEEQNPLNTPNDQIA